MKRSGFVWSILVLCALLYAQTWGTHASMPRGARHISIAAAQLASSSTLRVAMPDTSVTVDPAQVADEDNVQLASLLYSGLVRMDANYRVIPDAAARFTVSEDHKVYTFYLRKNLKFSNGDPVTADDFRFAITRSLLPSLKSPSAPTYLLDIQGAHDVLAGKTKTVSGIKVVNSSTLRITTRWAVPYFPMELTYPTSFALDKKQIRHLGPTDNTRWYSNPVGTGPYRLKSWTPNVQMVLTRNPNYYGPRPAVGKIVLALAPFTATGSKLYSYVSQSLDIAALPSSDMKLTSKPGVRETSMLSIAGIYMNARSKPFSSAAVRRAFTLALSRQKLVSDTLGDIVTPFAGSVPPGEWGADKDLKILPTDASRARAALAAGGYQDPKTFPDVTLYYSVDQQNPSQAKRLENLVTAIAKAWKKALHVTVGTKQLTLLTLYAKAQSNSLPLYISGWSADYPDPHDWLSAQWKTHALNNSVQYSNSKFDKLVSAADVTWNMNRRLNLYDQAQQVLVNDAAWIPLYVPHRLVYIRPDVSNLVLTGYGVIPRNGSWAGVAIRSSSAGSGKRG